VRGLTFNGATCTIVLLASILTLSGANWPQSGLANKISHLTFSYPVQVPGATLPAGTYTFSLVSGPSANQRIVRVISRNGDKVVATILTIPDYRRETKKYTAISFGEKGPCSNFTSIKSWFYPGEQNGYRFIYPRNKPPRSPQHATSRYPRPVPRLRKTAILIRVSSLRWRKATSAL
jgi:hypothetical protein